MDKNRLATIEERCTRTLIGLLCPLLMKIYQEMYNEVRARKGVPYNERLAEFQRSLKATPLWNSLEIDKRVDLIVSEIPDLMEVLEAVFMVNAQLWGSVRFGNNQDDDDITLQLPTKGDFVHKLVIRGAEKIYEDPYLFDDSQTQREQRENRTLAFGVIEEACRSTLDKCFPRGEILKKFLTLPTKGAAPPGDDAISDSGSDVSEDLSVGGESENADDDEPAVGQVLVSDSESESDDEEEPQVKKIPTSMSPSDFGASSQETVLPDPPQTLLRTPFESPEPAPVVQAPPPPPVETPPVQHVASASLAVPTEAVETSAAGTDDY